MNRLKGLLSIVLLVVIWSGCTKEALEYGDKTLASELQIISITDSVGGYDYNFINPESTDTTYIRYYLKKDSVFLEDGSFDKIELDTIYYEGETARLYTLPLIVLPKYKNRLYIRLNSNARWTAPTIPFSSELATWIKNVKVAGVGDAILDYNIKPRSSNPNSTIATRRKVQTQYITTQDSTVMYKLQFSQKSMVEE